MLSLKQKQSGTRPWSRQSEFRWNVLFEDLSFLGSLYFAHFIVWRVLCRRRKERAIRLKRIKLVQGAKTMKRMTDERLESRLWLDACESKSLKAEL
jgi:hypothetical protein